MYIIPILLNLLKLILFSHDLTVFSTCFSFNVSSCFTHRDERKIKLQGFDMCDFACRDCRWTTLASLGVLPLTGRHVSDCVLVRTKKSWYYHDFTIFSLILHWLCNFLLLFWPNSIKHSGRMTCADQEHAGGRDIERREVLARHVGHGEISVCSSENLSWLRTVILTKKLDCFTELSTNWSPKEGLQFLNDSKVLGNQSWPNLYLDHLELFFFPAGVGVARSDFSDLFKMVCRIVMHRQSKSAGPQA